MLWTNSAAKEAWSFVVPPALVTKYRSRRLPRRRSQFHHAPAIIRLVSRTAQRPNQITQRLRNVNGVAATPLSKEQVMRLVVMCCLCEKVFDDMEKEVTFLALSQERRGASQKEETS